MIADKYIEYAERTRNSFKRYDDIRDADLTKPCNVTAVEDIPYGNNERFNLLDIYFPKNISFPYKTIVSIHGGAYVYGDKERYHYYCMDLSARGFAVVNFSYRLASESPYPSALEDINKVFHFIYDNHAKYNIDLNNLFIVGDSAGAQLAAQYISIFTNAKYRIHFAFEVPDIKIKGCALNCGMYDMKNLIINPEHKEMFETYFQGRENKFTKQLETLEAITHEFPPCYVMTAYYDFLKSEAQPLLRVLKEKKIPHHFKIYGSSEQCYMSHVFHLNIKNKEAIQCNNDECNFFNSL